MVVFFLMFFFSSSGGSSRRGGYVVRLCRLKKREREIFYIFIYPPPLLKNKNKKQTNHVSDAVSPIDGYIDVERKVLAVHISRTVNDGRPQSRETCSGQVHPCDKHVAQHQHLHSLLHASGPHVFLHKMLFLEVAPLQQILSSNTCT